MCCTNVIMSYFGNVKMSYWRCAGKRRFRDISESFRTACDDADIEGITLHTLRHTAGSKMVESGIDLPTVAKILGLAVS